MVIISPFITIWGPPCREPISVVFLAPAAQVPNRGHGDGNDLMRNVP